MSAFLAYITSAAFGQVVRKATWFLAIASIFAFVISTFVLPNLSLPVGLVNFFKGSTIQNVYNTVDLFLPVSDIINCVLVVLVLRISHFTWNLAMTIGKIFMQGASS